MNKNSFSSLLFFLFSTLCLAYDPPEIIGILHGTGNDTAYFGEDFCCVGDQNGDGYDDLLVNHFPSRDRDRVELFLGGEEMDNDPDMIFETEDALGIGQNMNYLGDLTGEGTSWFAFYATLRIEGDYYSRLFLYEGGENLDNEPEFTITRPQNLKHYL